jgi:(1->4)-alpha-D-glucan 1-alpha-D-glucosylmutase
VPTSTYRLQVHAGFGYDDAAAVVPYLASLGVSHLYLSPVLAAVPGSMHGYDVVDHDQVSVDAGGREALERLASVAHDNGLGIVVDVVPNHMAVPTPAHLNAPLWSVLRDGRGSAFAHWFDVDWAAEDDKLLRPVLGADLSEVLEAGELTVADDGGRDGDEPVLRYWDNEFPIAPGTEVLPLAELVDAQHYRLTHWREGEQRLNYRRFFDVTGLIAIRVEERDVFDATHRLLLDLHRSGVVDGFRIDHPDGLADPAGYVRRLDEATNGAWVVVEKILEGEETLPVDWPCAGTTGYDTLLRVQQLFVDPAGEAPLTRIWQEQSRDLATLEDLVLEAKAQVVHEVLPAEINRLVRDIDRILPGHDAQEVRLALGELLVSMDRYRAYLVPGEPADPAAVEVVRAAARRARELLARGDYPALRTVVDLVTGTGLPAGVDPTDPDVADVIVRFQQTCGPVMAKGIEDTAFYRYARLTGLNEVGGDPGHLGIDPEDVHDFATRLLETTPTTMTAGSTHDTKRSEDVRARLSVLSERPEEWGAWLERARELASPPRRSGVDGATEYLIWQTLVGAWPIDESRMAGYVEKAVRESKARTTWTDVDETDESAIGRLVTGILGEPAVARHIEEWLEANAVAIRANTLGQKAVQLLLPGVPDVYQGTERVDLSLVDPDNRRPVDYDLRRDRLDALDGGAEPDGLDDEKLLVTAACLRLRREHPGWFTGPEATYSVVPTSSERAFAFGRGDAGGVGVVLVATRLATGVERDGGWGEHAVTLPDGSWRDLLTDRGVAPGADGKALLANVLRDLPVAVLVRRGE